MKSILEEAAEIVNGPRQEDYGDFNDNAAAIAGAFSHITGIEIKPPHVAIFHMVTKLVREGNKPGRDNRVDIAGYADRLDRMYQPNQSPNLNATTH